MSQDKIQITNTPPLPGTQLVQELNDAFEALATDFSGSVDPAAYAFAYSLWADTGTGDLKRRNAANNAWTKVGRIYPSVVEDSSGNLGLGVTPSAWNSLFKVLEIGSAASFVGTFNSADIYVAFNGYFDTAWKYKTNNYATRYTQGNGAHTWFTAPSGTAGNAISFSQAMTLDASGNLLVGKTSTSSQTTTDGFLVQRNASGGGTVTYVTNGGSGTALAVGAQADSAAVVFFRSGSAVGSISVTSTSTSYVTSSDYRLKENVAPMTGALEKVAQLKPCTYTWKADGSAGQGFIAHELQAVVPDCVTGEKDAVDKDGKPQYQGVDTSFLVATLVSAIQELKAEFDAYKAAHP